MIVTVIKKKGGGGHKRAFTDRWRTELGRRRTFLSENQQWKNRSTRAVTYKNETWGLSLSTLLLDRR